MQINPEWSRGITMLVKNVCFKTPGLQKHGRGAGVDVMFF